MSNKIKLSLEFEMKCSISVLFKRLSTASGLNEWFADDVLIKNNIFTFIWDEHPQEAELIHRNDKKSVRFRWLEDDPEYYFEFNLKKLELTGDLALTVVDFVDEEDVDSQTELWNSQIDDLRRVLGA